MELGKLICGIILPNEFYPTTSENTNNVVYLEDHFKEKKLKKLATDFFLEKEEFTPIAPPVKDLEAIFNKMESEGFHLETEDGKRITLKDMKTFYSSLNIVPNNDDDPTAA